MIILVFTIIGALSMLESAQASDCRSYGVPGYVYIVRMGSIGRLGGSTGGQWYKIGASINPQNRFPGGKSTDNPLPLRLFKQYPVLDCKRAEDAVKLALRNRLGVGRGGTEWYLAKRVKDVTDLVKIVEISVLPYMKKSPWEVVVMAEDANDRDDTIDSGNTHRRLKKLLTNQFD